MASGTNSVVGVRSGSDDLYDRGWYKLDFIESESASCFAASVLYCIALCTARDLCVAYESAFHIERGERY